MDILCADFLEKLLNVSGVCLWGITMLYLMRQKTRSIKGNLKNNKSTALYPKSFDEEVTSQLVIQQFEDAFKRIHHTLRIERQLLNELLESGTFYKMKKRRRDINAIPKQDVPFQLHGNKKYITEKHPESGYAEVFRLSDHGMNANKISERVKIPRGEVEMIIKLRKKKQQARKRQSAAGM